MTEPFRGGKNPTEEEAFRYWQGRGALPKDERGRVINHPRKVFREAEHFWKADRNIPVRTEWLKYIKGKEDLSALKYNPNLYFDESFPAR
jgi:hypothetical protein